MANGKVPYDKLENTGDGAVYGSRITVSSTNSDSISEAVDKLEQGVSNTSFKTRRDFAGVPANGDTQYHLFGRGALPNTGFRWNETTDVIEFSNDGVTWVDLANAGGSSTQVETVVVDNQIVNVDKYYDLNLLPTNPDNVRVLVSGAATEVRFPGDDYTITVDGGALLKRVDWETLGLDGDLTIGDKVLFIYETTENFSGISSGPVILKVDALTLSGGDISLAYKDLTEIPLDYTQVALFVAGGTAQVYGTDYSVTVDGGGDLKRLTWTGTPLDTSGDLAPGDVLIAMYNIGSGAGGALVSEHIEVDTVPFTGNLNGLVPPATLQDALEEIDQISFSNTAASVTTSTTNFDSLLTASETNVQLALDKLNDVRAQHIPANTFTGNLSGDLTVQAALNTLDAATLGGSITLRDTLAAWKAITRVVAGVEIVKEGSGLLRFDPTATEESGEGFYAQDVGSGLGVLELASPDMCLGLLGNDINESLQPITAYLDFASIAASSVGSASVTVYGARDGDPVLLGVPSSLSSSLIHWAKVTADDVVTIYLFNTSGAPIDPVASNFNIMVHKPARLPAITLRGLKIKNNLLSGSYVDGAALDADLAESTNTSDFWLLLANTQHKEDLLNDVAAYNLLKDSVDGDAIMSAMNGGSY